jgi:hypothetical protein
VRLRRATETNHDTGIWVIGASSWSVAGHFKHAIKWRDNFKVHSYISKTNQPTYVLYYLRHNQTVNLTTIYIPIDSKGKDIPVTGRGGP